MESQKRYRKSYALQPSVGGGAYTSGDAIGTLQTLSGAFRVDQAGRVLECTVIDVDNQKADLDILLFQSNTLASGVNNAPFAPAEAELKEIVGVVSVTAADYVDVGTSAFAQVDIELDLQLEASQNLFAQIVSRGTPTYSDTDNLEVRLIVLQD